MTAAEVSAFVLAEASRRQGTSIRSVATALRSLLVFLHVEGMLERSLAGAVPGVGAWRAAGLPRPLEAGELGLLMASCDRRTGTGRRDFAILMLRGRLGLRCGEVAGMTLDDIDWRAGEILIYGKGRRDDRLPLPVDVGDALANYVRRGRPSSALGSDGVRAGARATSSDEFGGGQPGGGRGSRAGWARLCLSASATAYRSDRATAGGRESS